MLGRLLLRLQLLVQLLQLPLQPPSAWLQLRVQVQVGRLHQQRVQRVASVHLAHLQLPLRLHAPHLHLLPLRLLQQYLQPQQHQQRKKRSSSSPIPCEPRLLLAARLLGPAVGLQGQRWWLELVLQ